MTRSEKLLCHLEEIIMDDLEPGVPGLNANQIDERIKKATIDQRRRAYERALVRNPVLLEDEK